MTFYSIFIYRLIWFILIFRHFHAQNVDFTNCYFKQFYNTFLNKLKVLPLIYQPQLSFLYILFSLAIFLCFLAYSYFLSSRLSSLPPLFVTSIVRKEVFRLSLCVLSFLFCYLPYSLLRFFSSITAPLSSAASLRTFFPAPI